MIEVDHGRRFEVLTCYSGNGGRSDTKPACGHGNDGLFISIVWGCIFQASKQGIHVLFKQAVFIGIDIWREPGTAYQYSPERHEYVFLRELRVATDSVDKRFGRGGNHMYIAQ